MEDKILGIYVLWEVKNDLLISLGVIREVLQVELFRQFSCLLPDHKNANPSNR
jgi:hypothetical protein